MDWKNLSFSYTKTNYNARCYYKNGKWGSVEVTDSEYINMHMAATCLHYGRNESIYGKRRKDSSVSLGRECQKV